jgi:hypothetical protein
VICDLREGSWRTGSTLNGIPKQRRVNQACGEIYKPADAWPSPTIRCLDDVEQLLEGLVQGGFSLDLAVALDRLVF